MPTDFSNQMKFRRWMHASYVDARKANCDPLRMGLGFVAYDRSCPSTSYSLAPYTFVATTARVPDDYRHHF